MRHKSENTRNTPHLANDLARTLRAEIAQKTTQLGEFAALSVSLMFQISKLTAQIAAQSSQLTAKDDEIKAMSEELAKLKARMKKDSHNSSKPPSTDGLNKKTKSLRKPSTKPVSAPTGNCHATMRCATHTCYGS